MTRVLESSGSRCAKCGEALSADDRFCRFCGATANAGEHVAVVEDEDAWAQYVARLREATSGEFEILRELGRGGMAAVYLAHEIALNRKVAIKLMSPALLTGEGMVRRFRQEAVTVANMSHPHIITLYSVRNVADLHFFVMKFVEGRSLEHIVRSRGALPLPMVRALLWMVGNALAYAHRRGVVHRDIKPANILVDEDGNAVVTDFGIAKLIATDAPSLAGSAAGQTRTGVLVGTPAYMSPEQCLARPISAASDQYALGLVGYELLTGHPPFLGSSFIVMHAHTERAVPSIREQRADCPEELEAAVMRMLAKDPDQRWPSMQHALAALGAAPLGDTDVSRAELARLAIPEPFRRSSEVLQTIPSPPPISASANVSDRPTPYVAAVEIFEPPESVETGDSFTLTASPRNASGDTMPGIRVHWASSDAHIATIDPVHGVVHGVAPGMVQISATAKGIRNTVDLTIVAKRVAAVNVSIPPGFLHAGDRVQLVATAEDKRHEPLSRRLHWSSENESVAVVSEDGVFTAKSPGQVLVWAEADGVRGVAHLEVTPASVAGLRLVGFPPLIEVGESATLRVTPLDAHGATLGGRTVTWESSDPAIAEVSSVGVIRGLAPGLARVICRSEGREAAAELRIVQPVVASIRITPPPNELALGIPITLHAAPVSTRSLVFDRPVSWRSESPAIATIDANGVLLPLATGIATIVATADDVEASIRLRVLEAPSLIAPKVPLTDTVRMEFEEAGRILGRKTPKWLRAAASPRRGVRRWAAVGIGGAGVAGLVLILWFVLRPGPTTETNQVSNGATAKHDSLPAATRQPDTAVEKGRIAATTAAIPRGRRDTVVRPPVAARTVAAPPAPRRETTTTVSMPVVEQSAKAVAASPTAPETTRVPATVPDTTTQPPKAPVAAPTVDVASLLRARIDEFLRALGDHDIPHVTALYAAQTGADQQNLAWLQDKLRRSEAKLSVADSHVAATQLGDAESTTDFSGRIRWTTPFGREKSVVATFRARVVRNGEGWRFAGIRVVGSLE